MCLTLQIELSFSVFDYWMGNMHKLTYFQALLKSYQTGSKFGENPGQSGDEHYSGDIRVNNPRTAPMSPVMTKRQVIAKVAFVSIY